MTALLFRRPADIRAGSDLGPTPWRSVGSAAVDRFIAASGDPEASYLALSLAGVFVPEMLDVPGASNILNYGCDRARFGAPVPAPSRLRARGTIASVTPVAGGVQVALELSIELEGSEQPACVVRSILRYLD
jgi:acyl dehydratase